MPVHISKLIGQNMPFLIEIGLKWPWTVWYLCAKTCRQPTHPRSLKSFHSTGIYTYTSMTTFQLLFINDITFDWSAIQWLVEISFEDLVIPANKCTPVLQKDSKWHNLNSVKLFFLETSQPQSFKCRWLMNLKYHACRPLCSLLAIIGRCYFSSMVSFEFCTSSIMSIVSIPH